MLDEPANGLDPEGIRWMRGLLRHLAGEGKTVLVSSHMLSEVQQTVDDVVIIANGRLVRQGSMEELQGSVRTLVRTPGVAALRDALATAGIGSQQSPAPDGLVVDSSDLGRIGDVAFAAGVAVHELRSLRSDLERLFLTLTETPEHRNRNLGADLPAVPEVPAP